MVQAKSYVPGQTIVPDQVSLPRQTGTQVRVPNLLGSRFINLRFRTICRILRDVCKLWESLILTVRTFFVVYISKILNRRGFWI